MSSEPLLKLARRLVALSVLQCSYPNNLFPSRYSVRVIDNPNLQYLFPDKDSNSSDGLVISKGKVFFHFNPKLCKKEIEKISELTEEEEGDKDISTMSNGNRAICAYFFFVEIEAQCSQRFHSKVSFARLEPTKQ